MHIYSYEVCYFDKMANKIKRRYVTNTYQGAVWDMNYHSKHPPGNQHEWFIKPVTNLIKHKWLWKGCPFQDALYHT